MKIVVLGATGGIGVEIIRQAIDHGHAITAFVRSPGPLKTLAGRINVVQGDALNRAELERVLTGQDAVLSGFGPRVPISKNDAHLLQHFGNALTSAMQRVGVQRIVAVSVAFLFKDSIIPPAYLVGRLFFNDLVHDAAEMEDVIEKSALDWTIVRPPRLTDKPRTGKYRAQE